MNSFDLFDVLFVFDSFDLSSAQMQMGEIRVLCSTCKKQPPPPISNRRRYSRATGGCLSFCLSRSSSSTCKSALRVGFEWRATAQVNNLKAQELARRRRSKWFLEANEDHASQTKFEMMDLWRRVNQVGGCANSTNRHDHDVGQLDGSKTCLSHQYLSGIFVHQLARASCASGGRCWLCQRRLTWRHPTRELLGVVLSP